MCRRIRGVYDEEEERKGECEREGYGRAIDAKVGVVHEVDIERDIDGGYEDENVGRRIHNPYNLRWAVNCSRCSSGKGGYILYLGTASTF